MSIVSNLTQWFNKITKEQYDVTIYLDDNKQFPNGK